MSHLALKGPNGWLVSQLLLQGQARTGSDAGSVGGVGATVCRICAIVRNSATGLTLKQKRSNLSTISIIV